MNQISPISPRSSSAGPSMASIPVGGSHESELREWLRLFNRRKMMIIGMGLLAVAVTALVVRR